MNFAKSEKWSWKIERTKSWANYIYRSSKQRSWWTKTKKHTNAIKRWSKLWKRKPWILYYFRRSKAGHEYGDSGRLANLRGQNPWPNGGTWQHQANPRFRPHQGRAQNNPWDEIAFLKQQLQASHYHQNELYWKLVAANKRASDYQSQLNQLHAQMKGHHLISRTPRPITGLFGK